MNMNLGMVKRGGEILALGSVLGVLIAGCGGGGSSDSTSVPAIPIATAAAPITTTFIDFNYLQNPNGAASAVAATIYDTASGTQVNNLSFGLTTQTTSYNLPDAYVGGTHSTGVVSGMGFVGWPRNTIDSNAPAIAMICQTIAGVGSANGKSTDVLVSDAASAITSATTLAGQSFTSYYEDCAVESGLSAIVDATGNATFHTQSGTINLTASQFTAMLTGTPNASFGGLTTFNAYGYQTAAGATKYVLVEHGGNTATAPTLGYVSVWMQ